jgi:hypothetical protein
MYVDLDNKRFVMANLSKNQIFRDIKIKINTAIPFFVANKHGTDV